MLAVNNFFLHIRKKKSKKKVCIKKKLYFCVR